jgi:hypothetical protein
MVPKKEAPMQTIASNSAPGVESPRLLDQVGQAARQRGASEPTTAQIVAWVRAFVLFHGKQHPRDLGAEAIRRFLEHVVSSAKQPLAALEMARSALEVLYHGVLGVDLGELPRPLAPRLLDQLSQVLRVRHYSRRTEACYVHWARHSILYHGKRHPRDMGAAEVEQFLTHLAVEGRVSASTQNQALNALVFLYNQVLHIDLGPFENTRGRPRNWAGNSCLLRGSYRVARAQVGWGRITSIRPRCSGPWRLPARPPD